MPHRDSPSSRHRRPRWLRVIANGRAAASAELRAAVSELRLRGHRIDVRAIWEAGDARSFAREAAEAGCDTVIAAGGDGTLNEVVNGVMASRARSAVGVLPFGTANDFATAARVPAAASEALALTVEQEAAAIDVCQLNDRFFINVASGGFGARVTAQTPLPLKQALGGTAYLLTGIAQLVSAEPHQARFNAPNLHWEGSFYVLAVGNARQAGGGFVVCPRARVNDGMLDVTVMPSMGFGELMGVLGDLLLKGSPAENEEVVYFRVPHLAIHAREPLHMNVDGEPAQGRTFHFRVLTRGLRFHLPADSPLTAAEAVPAQGEPDSA